MITRVDDIIELGEDQVGAGDCVGTGCLVHLEGLSDDIVRQTPGVVDELRAADFRFLAGLVPTFAAVTTTVLPRQPTAALIGLTGIHCLCERGLLCRWRADVARMLFGTV